jgi:ABC-type glycerol-3-phosphate transport system substrate-binding protein
VVCPSNLTSFQETLNSCSGGDDGDSTTNAVGTKTITLKFLVGTFGAWIEESAKEFNQLRDDVNVEILVVSMSELSPNIINEATSKTGLFDGFVTPPGVMGSIVSFPFLAPLLLRWLQNTFG